MRITLRHPAAGAATRSAPTWQPPRLAVGLTALLVCGVASDASAAERSLDKEVLVPASQADVWRAWTTRDGIISFFAPDAEVDPRVGGDFHVFIDPLAAPGSRGADDMRYMALQPPQMLSFDWNAPPSLPQARTQRTFVVLRFEPVDDKTTRVRLHHTGWGDGGEWDKAYSYFDRAWSGVLGNLKQRFEKGPMDWTDWLARLRQMHAAPPAPAASAATR